MPRRDPRWASSSQPHLCFVPFQHPGPGILHLKDTVEGTHRVYQSPHFAINLTPPNLPRTFTPRPTSKTGLVPKPQVSLCEVEKLGQPFNRLGSSWCTETPDRSLAHSRSSRPPATNVQMHARSDPISLGGDLHHLVTRSNPACLGDYTCLHIVHGISIQLLLRRAGRLDLSRVLCHN